MSSISPVSHPWFVYVVAALAGLGGLLFGYDTGVISGALLFITKDFGLSTWQQEVVVSILLLGAAVGAVFAGRIADGLGRKLAIIISAVLFVVGALYFAQGQAFLDLVIARFIIGIAIGIGSMAVPLYVSEISPPDIRGFCVSLNQLMVTIGIVAAYGIDYAFSGWQEGWRYMVGSAVVPSAILFIGMCFLPNSPRWLIAKGRYDKAIKILRRFGEPEAAAQASLEAIEEGLRHHEGGVKELLAKKLRPALVAGILLCVFQQITGINTVIYYAPTIFHSAGMQSQGVAILATVGVGIVNVLMTIVALRFLDRWGRRPLLFIGVSAMTIALALLGWLWLPGERHPLATELSIISLMVYIGGFAISLGPIAWLFQAEVYPLKVRGMAMSVATVSNWLSNCLVALTFLTLLRLFGATATFWMYGVISFFCLIFVYIYIPETKGKTLEEIEAFWK